MDQLLKMGKQLITKTKSSGLGGGGGGGGGNGQVNANAPYDYGYNHYNNSNSYPYNYHAPNYPQHYPQPGTSSGPYTNNAHNGPSNQDGNSSILKAMRGQDGKLIRKIFFPLVI